MTDDVIDVGALQRLLEVIGGDPEDLNDLLEDYRSIAPELASQIGSAAGAGDLEALRIAAHSLKSSARDFGALRLASLCADLEHGCRSGEISDPSGMAAAVVSAEAAARQALSGLSAEDLCD